MTPEQAELLTRWSVALEAAQAAKPVLEAEQKLRKEVFSAMFPDPKEGTNTIELEAGWKLKGVYKLERKLDVAALDAVKKQLRDMNVNPDALIEMHPSLVTPAYKALWLTHAEAGVVFDQALTIKPASPTLELIPPKAPK